MRIDLLAAGLSACPGLPLCSTTYERHEGESARCALALSAKIIFTVLSTSA